MPGKRSASQTLIAFPLEADLFAEVETARGRVSRSQWCREAIVEKLKRMGFDVPDDLMYPPDRAKKIVINSGIQQTGDNNTATISNQPSSNEPPTRQRKPGKPRNPSKGKRKPGSSA